MWLNKLVERDLLNVLAQLISNTCTLKSFDEKMQINYAMNKSAAGIA